MVLEFFRLKFILIIFKTYSLTFHKFLNINFLFYLLFIINLIVSVLSVFNIVKFNNDVCTAASGGSTFGTCYTASECTTLGGTSDGTCASSFGVCCTGDFIHLLIN